MGDETPKVENTSSGKTLCKKGCGFYGSIEFKDMCSKCYRAQSSPVANSTNVPTSVANEMPDNLSSDKMSIITSDTTRSLKRKHSDSFGNETDDGSNIHKVSLLDDIRVPDMCDDNQTVLKLVTVPKANDVAHQSIALSPVCLSKDNGYGISEAKATINSSSVENTCRLSASESSSDSSTPKQKRVSRCATCKKRVGLTGFVCHCEGLYCSLHRYPDTHGCKFDYKKEERARLAKENPTVRSAKIRKI